MKFAFVDSTKYNPNDFKNVFPNESKGPANMPTSPQLPSLLNSSSNKQGFRLQVSPNSGFTKFQGFKNN